MNKSIIGIDHPAVAAVDPTKLADWYENVLGYEKFHHTEKNVWIMRAKDGTLLEIMPKDETNRPNRTCWTPGWSHLALRVNDLETATAELRKHGVRLEDAVPAIGGGMLRSFYDPEGNMLQIVQRDNS